MATETLTPQQKQNAAIEAALKEFLKTAVRRDGKKFTATALQYNAQGTPNLIKGTADTTDDKGATVTVPMFWNIQGAAQAQNPGVDLVTEQKL